MPAEHDGERTSAALAVTRSQIRHLTVNNDHTALGEDDAAADAVDHTADERWVVAIFSHALPSWA